MYTLLIQAHELQQLHTDPAHLVVFDCSFDLGRPAAADELFAQSRIAGAQQAHLERDLSTHDASQAVNGGRHPLPRPEILAQWLGHMGVDASTQVVVYDRNAGHYCARLWWMLKWLGHEAVAVLDGGLQAWQALGGALDSGPAPAVERRHFEPRPALIPLLRIEQVAAQLGRPQQTLIDARAAARYRGEVEPLDPVAGHIPGALNRPFVENFTPSGHFKPASQLRAEFETLLAGRPASSVVHHCGSGVTAAPNLLAMEIAGLHGAGLYAGSWSEWCTTPNMPCAQG